MLPKIGVFISRSSLSFISFKFIIIMAYENIQGEEKNFVAEGGFSIGMKSDELETTLLLNHDLSKRSFFISLFYNVFTYLKMIFIHLHNYFIMTLKEVKNRTFSFVLGVVACMIVVWMTTISFTALGHIPLVFLRLAEIRAGEYDTELLASNQMPGRSLNYSMLLTNPLFLGNTPLSYHAPRFISYTKIYSAKSCEAPFIPQDLSNATLSNRDHWMWMYNDTCSSDNCLPEKCSLNIAGNIALFNETMEKKMGWGRDWDLNNPSMRDNNAQLGAAFISEGLAIALNVSIGDVIIFGIPQPDLIGVFRASGIPVEENNGFSSLSLNVPFSVGHIYSKSYGKFGGDVSDSLLINYDNFLLYSSRFLYRQYNSTEINNFSNVNFFEYANRIYFNHHDRMKVYNKADYDDIQLELTAFASRVVYFLGFDQLTSNFPILRYIYNTRFMSLFLGLGINVIITVLTVLAIVLIYSLLLINVETRTFELVWNYLLLSIS